SESSILMLRRSPLPESVTLTMPPPAVPSTSRRSSSACMFSILDLSSAACFIRPIKSGIGITFVLWRQVLRQLIRMGRRGAGGRTDFDDLGAGEAGEHGLHQRIAARVVFHIRLAGFG